MRSIKFGKQAEQADRFEQAKEALDKLLKGKQPVEEKYQIYLQVILNRKYHGMLPEEVLILRFMAGLINKEEFEDALKGIWKLNVKPTGEAYEPFYARILEKLKPPAAATDLAVCNS
jgi:hypothetical protein